MGDSLSYLDNLFFKLNPYFALIFLEGSSVITVRSVRTVRKAYDGPSEKFYGPQIACYYRHACYYRAVFEL